MNVKEVLGAFLLVNNPIVLSEEEIKDVQKSIKQLRQENKKLKEKLDKYENPEDMTLFTMWCTEKVKDENKKLKDNWKNLKQIIKKKFVAQGGFTSYEWNDLLNDLLNKMQKLEGDDSNEKDN